ncbi:hypothetical protein DdX_12591 [Ditylenchus destructor]|uniref:Uncharacterized protein n=1 Tax=Ditylenchus destructor TaxID=166010 RepID=A0AAD4R0B7_9BILA|nr:hypothetical protein DdX_12591 [Ditylenchus destructor]
MSKLSMLALVAAFFAFAAADFATLQEQTEDEAAMSKSRYSNFELLLKDEHNAAPLYKKVEKECDDVEHQFDLMVAEIVKLREKKDLQAGFRGRVNPKMINLTNEIRDVENLVHDKKGEIEKMLHDKVTHAVLLSPLDHGYKKFGHLMQKINEFEDFANKA